MQIIVFPTVIFRSSLLFFIVFPLQDSRNFGDQIRKALLDLAKLLNPEHKEPRKTDERQPEVKKDL